MISLFDADPDTSDSEDVDYVPSKADAGLSEASDNELVSSENERDDGEEVEKIKSSKKRKGRSRKSLKEEVSCEESKNSSNCHVANNGEKEKPNDIWKRFLEEVNETKKEEINDEKEGKISEPSSASDVPESKEDSLTEKVEISNEEEKKKKTTTVFEFAGEAVVIKDDKILNNEPKDTSSNSIKSRVQETCNASSNSLKQGVKRKRGLDAVLETVMNKKHKLTTLEKTLYDWKAYKSDEGIEEELQHFNKGKGGFLERQKFLQRSDLRSFENEKATRLSKMKKH